MMNNIMLNKKRHRENEQELKKNISERTMVIL
jgi:hypothetical protein